MSLLIGLIISSVLVYTNMDSQPDVAPEPKAKVEATTRYPFVKVGGVCRPVEPASHIEVLLEHPDCDGHYANLGEHNAIILCWDEAVFFFTTEEQCNLK